MSVASPRKPRWFEPLGRPDAWSTGALMASLVVSSIVFIFGNLSIVAGQGFEAVGANTLLTVGVFGAGVFSARIIAARQSTASAGLTTLGVVVVTSGLRGALLHWLFGALEIDSDQSLMMRTVVSMTVFAPGLVLSVLVMWLIRAWRSDEARIRELAEQREQIQRSVVGAINQHTSEVTSLLEAELKPKLSELESLSAQQAQKSLSALVASVVKPLGTSLHATFPNVALPQARTVAVAVREFIALSLRGTPLAPGLTGIIFGFTLFPRTFASGPPLLALAWTVGLGLSIFFGTWLINHVSKRVPRETSLPLHGVIVFFLLVVLGAGVATLSKYLSSSDLGFDNVFLVGAAATTTLAVLLGGVVNARRYFDSQRARVAELEASLEQELAKARQLQWQRNRVLGTIVHGSLQAALNAGGIRLAQATNAAEVNSISAQLSDDVVGLLDKMRSADSSTGDLVSTMRRIEDTWEGLCDVRWNIDGEVQRAIHGHPVEAAISEVLIEAVYNAIKHQSPKVVEVTLEFEPSKEIRLEVSHLGQLDSSASPGLGTKILDYLTLHHSLSEEAGAVTFVALFPGQATRPPGAPQVATSESAG